MLVYRTVFEGECDNIGRLKKKEWYGPNHINDGDFYYVSNINTFRENMKSGEYLYFYAEDAIRKTRFIDSERMHEFFNPHVAEFDISVDLLALYMGLGITCIRHRNLSDDPYYITLEFALPYDVIVSNYCDKNGESYKDIDYYKDHRHSCITDRIYTIPYSKHLKEAEVPTDIRRESYQTFQIEELSNIMRMLNVGILPPEENFLGGYREYGFSELADDYSNEEAAKILRKLDGSIDSH